MNPPTKKLKQARLPFKVIASPSPNQCPKSPASDQLPTKKRKLSSSDKSPISAQPTKIRNSEKLGSKKPVDSASKKLFTPKKLRIETLDLEAEVTSSCEDQESVRASLSSEATPKTPAASARPKSLDGFLQTTQQPQVSTSDDVITISDEEDHVIEVAEGIDGNKSLGKENGIEARAAETVVEDSGTGHQPSSQSADTETVQSLSESNIKVKKQESLCKPDISPHLDDGNPTSRLGYDADSEDENDEDDDQMDPKILKTSEGSSEAESSSSSCKTVGSTPKPSEKPIRKTPLSAKALKKLQEKEQKRSEKMKLRMEKKRKLEEGEAERKRQKLDLKREKEREREEVRQQKELERDEKRKEKQVKKEQEERDKELKRMAKEEERKKKQEIVDAKVEEKRKKNEERQRQEEEKKRLEDEKHQKEAKQKNLFMSFFKEVAAPVKKPQEKSTSWFAPFEVKEHMVLAPLRRRERIGPSLEDFEKAFQNQNSTSLYVDELKNKAYKVGKTGQTPWAKSEEGQSNNGRTVTPSVEPMEQKKTDSQDVEIIPETPAEPAKKVVRMKCKLLQFHENYRPAYYGTWRKKSKAINPRNYLKKDEDLLDYEVDSDDEWEEPGESLSHSEGEDDAEDVEEAGDSDDGFFVPHGYLSESEGCEDEEEIENWKARRAAKAKSWEVELKRQQGVLKPIMVGCVWSTDATKPLDKTLEAFKIIAMTTVPINIRSRAQVAMSSELQSRDDVPRTVSQSKGSGGEGVPVKRPVPAEAMPDLIRLVHGNIAGIKTLQREFAAFWMQKDRKALEQSIPGPDSAGAATPGTERESQASKTSAEASPSPSVKLLSEKTGTALSNTVAASPSSSMHMITTPSSDGGTPKASGSNQTSPTVGSADAVECSISKRQLLLTIGTIAVRERRTEFPRTCWYVHKDLLEKYNLQNLPIPSQWQMVTKSQKTLRADSPLLVPSVMPQGNHTPAGYTKSSQGSVPMIPQQNQPPHRGMNQSLNHILVLGASPNASPQQVLPSSGQAIQANQRSSLLCSPLSLQQPLHQPGVGNITLPFRLQPSEPMSSSEIMQRLSAAIPLQSQKPSGNPSASLASMFNSVLASNNQLHYLNMLPKPEILPHETNVPLPGSPKVSQVHRVKLSQAVKVPCTSPDIKTMLSAQAAKAAAPSLGNNAPLTSSGSTTPISRVNQAPDAVSGLSTSPHTRDKEKAPHSLQQPETKPTTLNKFFNISVKPLPMSQPVSSNVNENPVSRFGESLPPKESEGIALKNNSLQPKEDGRAGDEEAVKTGEASEGKSAEDDVIIVS